MLTSFSANSMPNSFESVGAVRTRYDPVVVDLAGNIRRNGNGKGCRNPRQQSPIYISVRDPLKLTAGVIKSSKNMSDVHDLAALIHQLPRQRSLRQRSQSLIFNLDNRIRRGRNQAR